MSERLTVPVMIMEILIAQQERGGIPVFVSVLMTIPVMDLAVHKCSKSL